MKNINIPHNDSFDKDAKKPSVIEERFEWSSTKAQRFIKIIISLLVLYSFLLAVDVMGLGCKKWATHAEALLKLDQNRIVGLFIGILVTAIIQSSSTTTSLVVGMVAGGLLSLKSAIPIIMGANIGTSVTNTIVSLGHINRRDEFKRAFAAASVHDIFNIISVSILFPIELSTGFLERMATGLAEYVAGAPGATFKSPLKMVVRPISKLFDGWVTSATELLPQFCFQWMEAKTWTGFFLFGLGLCGTIFSLIVLVRFLRQSMMGPVKHMLDRVFFRNAYTAYLLGIIMTVMVQSSSITTSTIVPLAGAGILTLNQIFPFTLGANVGTTCTALLASLAGGTVNGLVIAFVHFFFNIIGTVAIWPIRFIPIKIAERWAEYITRKRKRAIIVIILIFFGIPGLTIVIASL